MNREHAITERLQAVFAPLELVVEDESHKHAGHAGARPEGQTHFKVRLVAQGFAGKNRVERHRMVNQALAELFAGGLHALALTTKAPGE